MNRQALPSTLPRPLPPRPAATDRRLGHTLNTHDEDSGGGYPLRAAGCDRARGQMGPGAPAYLIPLFWATLCRDSLDTAEMTCRRQQRRFCDSGKTNKVFRRGRELFTERVSPWGQKAAAAHFPGQAPTSYFVCCVKCVTSALWRFCRGCWGKRSQLRPRPTLANRKV